ncbi:MAG: DUF2938 domain-containing protein [Paenalcaligenes sp.]
MSNIVVVLYIGVGATLVMDVWTLILKAMGLPTLNYAMVGRWVGHWREGRFAHPHIAKAAPIKGELALGWIIHYVTGIVFAAVLVGVYGEAWLHNPTWLPALTVGVATVVMPWFVMQPAFGAGIAASRTPKPWASRLQSVVTHAVLGTGMYVSALALQAR